MRVETFKGRDVQIINIEEAGGEHIVEFVDSATESVGAVLAIYSAGEDWSEARVSISPRIDSVSTEFMEWALVIARHIL